jgi:hypothetical protein
LIAALFVFIASFPSPQGSSQDKAAWSSLPLPSVCIDPASAPYVARLLRGNHLLMQGDVVEREAPSQAAVLPVRSLLDWMQEEARRGPREVRVQLGAPPILVRGEANDVGALAQRLTDIDAATASLDVELRAWLIPASGPASTHPAHAELERAIANQAVWGEARVRSGQTVVFGERSEQSFLGGWSPLVTSSSGVAEPKLLRALIGQTLHLVAARSQAGARVRLSGFLDLSELGTLTVIDPSTPDLGVIQQPSMRALQVAFAGSVESGGVLAVSIEGAPLAQATWSLWIEARTKPDATSGGMRAVDLAWLEAPALPLPMVAAGAGLEAVGADEGSNNPLVEALSASSVAQTIEESRGRTTSGSRASVMWAPGLLFVPRDDAQANAEVDSLVAAASRARSAENDVVVAHGALKVRVPTTEGSGVRVLATNERTLVTGYSVEIATETWIPSPKVERVLDGIWVQGQWRSGRFVAAGWTASSEVTALLSREEARLGRMQLVKRTFRGERAMVDRDRPRVELTPAQAGAPALSVEIAGR